MKTDIQIYKEKNNYMDALYPEVTAEELYRSIFPLEQMENKKDNTHRFSNPIFTYMEKDSSGRSFFRNEIVFADCFKESLRKTEKNEFALCSMISYSGKRKSAKNAYRCHGFVIDLDGVGLQQLSNFWGWVEHLERIPCPTYVANSGHGLHVYYVFENPVPLYPQVAQYLQLLKRGLTGWVWNKETSTYRPEPGKPYDTCRQYQGIYQSFRMVGSRTKLGKGNARNKYLVKAWKTGKPVTIEQLNEYVEDEYKCPVNPDYSSWDWLDGEHHSLSECQELYPDWYLRRIVRKEPAGQWKYSPGLYYWWLNKIQAEGVVREGNRYHCISMLYVYGQKCLIGKDKVTEDAMNLLELFDELSLHEDNRFTVEDIIAASKFYDTKYVKMSRKEISRKTGIAIEPTKRNGRTREEHLLRERLVQAHLNPNWRKGNGRPSAESTVRDWREKNPNGTKAQCIRETGLCKPTVYKWWN